MSAICIIEIAQLVMLIVVGLLLGWNPSRINSLQILLFLILGMACFAGIGLTLAGRLRAEVNLAAQNGLYLVFLMLGGIFVESDELPATLSQISAFSPSSLLSGLLRDSFKNTVVLADAFALCGWAIAACVLAVTSFKWSD